MVGYGKNGYRLWDPVTDTILTSRDVQFDETDFVYKSMKNDSPEWNERFHAFAENSGLKKS
jgi:hypothetical protein